ncbi:hypothetical protein ALQ65_200231 [Pseudomonas syringae pv. coriandricola]|uniref:Uncharacterized protein n=1 Tax=Pseudomonas syringae pv. coriandricola TaxID=264453 RepID=A0A3M3JLK3_9PSED|nr:hypothetical protein ALQ65_200231 [Pseudomonas syringae pv. coriandricola]
MVGLGRLPLHRGALAKPALDDCVFWTRAKPIRSVRVAQGIRTKVPAAMLTEEGQLTSDKKKQFFKLELQCLHHRVAVDPEDGSLIETLKLRVQDFTRFNEPAKAPKVYETQIVFDPDRFEALIHVPPERAWRNETLLALARDIAAKRGIQCPIPE